MTTILVVDDDADFLFQQKVQLEKAGYRVVTAQGFKEGMAALNRERPDVALVDLMMEEVDAGFTLCYYIKKKDATIPVIMVTGVSGETGMEFDASTTEEQSWIKADVLLVKPVRFEQLQREIDRLLKV